MRDMGVAILRSRESSCLTPIGEARHGYRESMMTDIGNAERVALMERLVALQVEHRDLDAVIHRLARAIRRTTSCS